MGEPRGLKIDHPHLKNTKFGPIMHRPLHVARNISIAPIEVATDDALPVVPLKSYKV